MKDDEQKLVMQNREVYDIIAESFFTKRQLIWEELKDLAKYSNKGDKVLDIGCGFGRLYHVLKDLQVSYVGVDQSEGQIRVANEKFPDLKFTKAEMTELPFEDNTFDIIYCIATFHHLPTKQMRQKALLEMKRVLKPHGKVIMTNWNLSSDWAKKKYLEFEPGDYMIPWKDEHGHVMGQRYYHAFTLDELSELFESSGFVIKDQYLVKKGEESTLREGENIVSIIGR